MSQSGEINVVSNTPAIPTSFVTDSGVAVPVANTLNVLGGTGITTAGAGNTVTITATGSTFDGLTPDDGVQVPVVAGNIDVFGATNNTSASQILETHNVGGNFIIEPRAYETPYVVDPSATIGMQGTYQTIQAAINAAVTDGAAAGNYKKIYIRTGSYTCRS